MYVTSINEIIKLVVSVYIAISINISFCTLVL